MIRVIILSLMICLPSLAQSAKWTNVIPELLQFKTGFWAGIVGPKKKTARIPFNRIKKEFRNNYLNSILSQFNVTVVVCNSEAIEFSNGSYAKALTAKETAETEEGETFHFLHFEECQKISQYQIYKVFHPMLASTNGTRTKAGTAWIKRCAFLDIINKNKRLNNGCHSEIDYKVVSDIDPIYAKYILNEIQNLPLGEEADEFRMSYLLEWILEYGMLIEHANFQKLIADGADGRPLFKRGTILKDKKSKYGIDWAKTNDLTWCFHGYEMGDHLQITDWIKFRGTNYPDQIDAITRWVKDHGEGYIVNDSTGVGDAPNDYLKREFGPSKVKGLKYTAPSKDALIKDWRTLLPSKKNGTGIFFPQCDKTDKEFRVIEQQFLDCEVETKGNLVAYHHGDEDNALDDTVDGVFNLIHGHLHGLSTEIIHA